MSYDKAITRAALAGHPSILLYGRRWALERGAYYGVEFNREAPGQSRVVRVRVPVTP